MTKLNIIGREKNPYKLSVLMVPSWRKNFILFFPSIGLR